MVRPLPGTDTCPATSSAFPPAEAFWVTQGPQKAASPLDLPHTSHWGPGAALAALPG